jgi:hypothetical protein
MMESEEQMSRAKQKQKNNTKYQIRSWREKYSEADVRRQLKAFGLKGWVHETYTDGTMQLYVPKHDGISEEVTFEQLLVVQRAFTPLNLKLHAAHLDDYEHITIIITMSWNKQGRVK